MESCPFESPDCPLFNTPTGCHSDLHHDFWPKRDYQTALEKEFRELPENKHYLPRCEHNFQHRIEDPPAKPSIEIMRHAIDTALRLGDIAISETKIRKIFGLDDGETTR